MPVEIQVLQQKVPPRHLTGKRIDLKGIRKKRYLG